MGVWLNIPNFWCRKFEISFKWLIYSATEDGAYCRFRIPFGSKNIEKGSHETSNYFDKAPFQTWTNAIKKFKEHKSKKYHQGAVEDAQNFKLIYENVKSNVVSGIDHSRKKLQLKNRQRPAPIVRAVLFCGRQRIALWGHRDYGPLSVNMLEVNDSNFRARLHFAMESGDSALNDHLKTANVNANYVSKNIQNQVIDAAGALIT